MKVALVGWGAIGRAVYPILNDAGIEVVAIATKDPRSRADLPKTSAHITDPAELEQFAPDVVAEAAGRDSVEPWGMAALSLSADFVVSSVSAFADPVLLGQMTDAAVAGNAQLHIHPGALGGIDALAAARASGIAEVEHRIEKPPAAWADTPAESLCDLNSLTEPFEFFTASAAETAAKFPKNANVAMTTALASLGPEQTRITLVADPSAAMNSHHIRASGTFGRMSLSLMNTPLPDNPKTSAMTVFNLARSITNRTSTIAI